MAFFGVFGESRTARALFDARSAYLCAPALHFSLDGRVALCHDSGVSLAALTPVPPALFVASCARGSTCVGYAGICAYYRKYGKRLRRYLPFPTAFAIYDAAKGTLLLGGTHGEKCFIEDKDDALFFSSESHLLRSPIPVDLALIK